MAKKRVGVGNAPKEDTVDGIVVDRVTTVATLALHNMALAESVWDDLSIEEQRKVENMLDAYFTQKLINSFISELYERPSEENDDDETFVYTIGDSPPQKKGKRSIKRGKQNPKESKK